MKNALRKKPEQQGATSAFNRVARRVLVAFGLLGIAGGAVAGTAHERPAVPVAIVQTEQAAQPAPKIKYKYSEARLDSIKTAMRATASGRALLDFAAEQNIRIDMSSSKIMDDNPKDTITIKGLNHSSYIELNGDISSDDEIMITLAHEIRHSWHERVVKSDSLGLSPRNEWLKRRIQEADCFAFEIHFAYEYEQATGKRLDLGDRNPANGHQTYGSLVSDYARLRANKNLTVGDAYSKLLEKTFPYVQRQGYDKSFTADSLRVWTAVAEKPGLRASYAKRMMNPASDAEFAAAMRKVATAGLKPGEDPAALASWLDSDFTSFSKTGGNPSGSNVKTFNKSAAKYDAARLAWQEMNAAKDETPPSAVPPAATRPSPQPGA